MPENPSPNRARRAAIVVGCLVVTTLGLACLNMVPIAEITIINELTAKGLVEAFLLIVAIYVLGSGAGAAIEKFAAKNKDKD
jgi:predicted membrane-bound spermidine synthase